MDGSFLLGFSSGFMRDVEIVNLAATQSSVVAKTFNFTGVSGVETINVGAKNAVINLSNINDVSPTVNVSGQATGTFEVGFASGLISGTGSAMTVGFTETGSIGSEVSLIANGITELTVNSFGGSNAVNLGNSQNDLVSISFGGTGDLYVSDIPTSVSGVEATGFGGDLTLTVDTDTNTTLLASGNTVNGGAGQDALRIMGSGIAAATTSSIEELIFDSSASEAIVRATGMANLNTLTFSGQGTNTPSISGIGDQALTVNAILATAGNQVAITGTGVLTVNLNADPVSNVAAAVNGANAFDFKANTSGNVTINVGPYTSASGTYNLNNADNDINVVLDANSVFSSNIKASGAQTVSITGSGKIDTETGGGISAQEATTINVENGAATGDIVISSSAIQTFTLTTAEDFTVTGRITGATTINVTTSGTADLSGLYHENLTAATFAGSGAAAFGTYSGSGTNVAFTLTGLGDGGFSASEIHGKSGDITISAENMSGSLVVNTSSASGVTVTGPINGQVTYSSIEATNFTFDGSASSASSGSLTIQSLSAGNNATVSLGSNASGTTNISAAQAGGALVLDSSNYGGALDFASISSSGNSTVSVGSSGDFSAGSVIANDFTLDGAAAATGSVTIGSFTARGNSTISMGSGTGALAVTSSAAGAGNLTIDAASFGGSIDISNVSVSGAVVVSLGSSGDFSAADVVTIGGAFTLDASNASTGAVTIGSISAGGNASVIMGAGTGGVAITTGGAADFAGTFTLDASRFGGTIDLNSVTGSGAVTVSVGTNGDLSAGSINTLGGITIDGAASTSGRITLGDMSSDGAMNVVLGTGTGAVALNTGASTKAVVVDATTFSGSVDVHDLSASGVTISLGVIGDYSGSSIVSTAAFTMDGTSAQSGEVTIGHVSAAGALTISMGSGSGDLAVNSSAGSAKTITVDTTNFKGNVDMSNVSASGAITVALGESGDFSAGDIISNAGAISIDATRATTGTITLTNISASGTVTLAMGGGSGALAITTGDAAGNFVIDASNHKGSQSIDRAVVSGNITVSIGQDKGDFSAGSIDAIGNLTIDMSAATQGDLNIDTLTANNVSIVMGTGTGDVIISAAATTGSFTIDAANYQDIVTLTTVSASGAVTLNLNSENFVASAINTSGAFTLAGHGSGNITLDGGGTTLESGISAAGAVSITHSGSGVVTISAVETGKAFTLDLTGSIDVTDGGNKVAFISASGVSVSLGNNNHFTAAVITGNGGSGAISIYGGTGTGDVVVGGYISGDGTVTIGAKGSGDTVISAINTLSSFTLDATEFSGGSNADIDFEGLSASGAIVMNFGNVAILNVSALETESTFTLNAQSSVSAEINIGEGGAGTVGNMSAFGAVTFNLGTASGDLSVTAINSQDAITISGASSKLAMDIELLSASGNISVSMGPVVLDGDGANISAIATPTGRITIDGTNYREKFDFSHMSASGITVTFGDLADEFDGVSMEATTLAFNGGDGSNFSANVTGIVLDGASGWSILMPELGNGLTLPQLTYSGGGTLTGTMAADNISAISTSQSGQSVTLDFDLREDSVTDVIDYKNGAGKEYLILRNFKGGQDDLDLTPGYGSATTTTSLDLSVGVTAAASLIGAALGTTVAVADVATAGGVTAVFTYNGDSWLLGNGDDGNGTWENGEAIIRFVGTQDLVAGDITFADG
jgi:hypothetical protein